MKLPSQDNSALIHLGFAVVTLGFCGAALFVHDPNTQAQLWHVVFFLIGLWTTSPAQSSAMTTMVQQLVPALTAITALAQHPTQATSVQPPTQPAAAQDADITQQVKAVPKETTA